MTVKKVKCIKTVKDALEEDVTYFTEGTTYEGSPTYDSKGITVQDDTGNTHELGFSNKEDESWFDTHFVKL